MLISLLFIFITRLAFAIRTSFLRRLDVLFEVSNQSMKDEQVSNPRSAGGRLKWSYPRDVLLGRRAWKRRIE